MLYFFKNHLLSNDIISQAHCLILCNPHTLHRGAICQFTFPWIYYYGSNKSTGKETGKTHKMLVLFLLPIVKPKTHSLSTNVLWLKNKGYKCYWEFIRVNAFSYKYNTTLLGILEYKSNIFF